jgi:uncharacterized protein YbgA (DUF1722 family)/uncharacterized protein YbbK (DUF523 family)
MMPEDSAERNKIRVGISACLLGRKVRYDGGHKLDHYLADTLGRYVEWVPVCPEVESGLPVPREAMRLVGIPETPRLVTVRSGTDHTDRMRSWAAEKVLSLEEQNLCGFVFKSRSPSSGMKGVRVYGESGAASRNGVGLFARVFMERFPHLPVEDEGRLHDPVLRENFIERLFVFRRWRDLLDAGVSARGLIAFHTDIKLLVLAHSTEHYRLLGRLVAGAGRGNLRGLHGRYLGLLMEGLALPATTRKNANVLQHIMGYFKKQLSADEKQELLEVIGHYRLGNVPLIAPIVLVKHYVRKYGEPYLERQHYLTPHPLELMLRNHG